MVSSFVLKLNLIISLAFHHSFQWYYCQQEQVTQTWRWAIIHALRCESHLTSKHQVLFFVRHYVTLYWDKCHVYSRNLSLLLNLKLESETLKTFHKALWQIITTFRPPQLPYKARPSGVCSGLPQHPTYVYRGSLVDWLLSEPKKHIICTEVLNRLRIYST